MPPLTCAPSSSSLHPARTLQSAHHACMQHLMSSVTCALLVHACISSPSPPCSYVSGVAPLLLEGYVFVENVGLCFLLFLPIDSQLDCGRSPPYGCAWPYGFTLCMGTGPQACARYGMSLDAVDLCWAPTPAYGNVAVSSFVLQNQTVHARMRACASAVPQAALLSASHASVHARRWTFPSTNGNQRLGSRGTPHRTTFAVPANNSFCTLCTICLLHVHACILTASL